MHTGTTLTQFIIEEQRRVVGATGDFTSLLNDIVTAIKVISNAVNKGDLMGVLGSAGSENIQGETQKKLDVITNDVMLRSNEWAGHLAAMASEEMEDIFPIPSRFPRGKYLLVFDPLDGSSNIDVNISVGTIFSILRCPDGVSEPTAADFLQPGTKQVAAGYALYGPSTMIMLTTGHGVNGFTLDRDVGEFLLTHRDVRITPDTREFAINASNERFWEEPVQRYVQECLQGRKSRAVRTSTCVGWPPWSPRCTASSSVAGSSCTRRTPRTRRRPASCALCMGPTPCRSSSSRPGA